MCRRLPAFAYRHLCSSPCRLLSYADHLRDLPVFLLQMTTWVRRLLLACRWWRARGRRLCCCGRWRRPTLNPTNPRLPVAASQREVLACLRLRRCRNPQTSEPMERQYRQCSASASAWTRSYPACTPGSPTAACTSRCAPSWADRHSPDLAPHSVSPPGPRAVVPLQRVSAGVPPTKFGSAAPCAPAWARQGPAPHQAPHHSQLACLQGSCCWVGGGLSYKMLSTC